MQRGGLKLAHQRRTRQLVLAALATAMMVAPVFVDAQATTRFAVAGHGTLVATGDANHDLRVLREGTSAFGFEPWVIHGAVPSGRLRPSGGVGGRFEILPNPHFSVGLLVSYARQRAAVGPDQRWRDMDVWLSARLPTEVGPRQLRVVPYLATPVGYSVMIGRLGGSSDGRRFGWNLSALMGVEIEAAEGFAVYLETGWLMRQARHEEEFLGRYRITFTTHQLVLHVGLRGSRGR